ncbi:MAG: hypothetical protein JNL18_08820 [Planctomycetaceae bacterium]|nr:hypothetical protein [Planctomycetaceae bacterium]
MGMQLNSGSFVRLIGGATFRSAISIDAAACLPALFFVTLLLMLALAIYSWRRPESPNLLISSLIPAGGEGRVRRFTTQPAPQNRSRL